MASTLAGEQLTQLHRRLQLELRSASLADVLRLWPAFDLERIDETWPALEAGLLAVILERRRQSAELAATYYRAFRALEGVPGEAPVRVAEQPSGQLMRATLRLLGPIAAKKAIAARRRNVSERVLVRLSGTVGRQSLDGGRQTLSESIREDAAAEGWRRVTDSDPCDFCRTIADAGVVGDRVDFQAHDHCGCTQEPSFAERVRSRFGETPAPGAFGDFLARFEADVAQRSASGTSAAPVVDGRGFRFVDP